jgi:predicted GNAT superfamily acetyltransferase
MNDTFSYQLIEGQPSKVVLKEILKVYQLVFEDYKLDFFKERIHQKKEVLIGLCYFQETLIGFKIGYLYNHDTLYSWVGGVLPNYRKQGIAQQLLTQQHTIAIKKGYKKIRTKSMNKFKPMIILNLKNGFDITQVYTNDSNQTKIVFEKDLTTEL